MIVVTAKNTKKVKRILDKGYEKAMARWEREKKGWTSFVRKVKDKNPIEGYGHRDSR